MKKRVLLVLCIIMLLIMSTALAVACDNKDKTPPDDDGGIIGDGGNNGGGEASGLVDISQYLTYELNEDGNSYAVTGLKDEIKDKTSTTFYEGDMYKSVDKVKITIPSQYEGKQVTAIGDDAFACCLGLVEITIPETVTSIGDRVFAYCIRLKGIDLPTNTSTLGEYAFVGCANLKSIVIPNQVKEIKSWTFGYCTGLEQVSLPDTLTSISKEAFLFCVGLTNIVIPSSVTKIDVGAFELCLRLIEIYNKSSLDIIAGSEDNGKVALLAKNVYTEEDGSKLSTYANDYLIFTDGEEKTLVKYTGEDKNLTLPNDITAINSGAFIDFSAPGLEWMLGEDTYVLESIMIPDSVTSIGSWAFFGCGNLSNVDIGDRVTAIGENAFAYCSNLTNITIPDGVTSIGNMAFDDCISLIEVYNKSSLDIVASSSDNGKVAYYAKNVYTEEGGSKLSTDESGYVVYTDGAEKILVKYNGNGIDLTLPNDIAEIYQYAFYNCRSLTSITIPNSVTSIGYGAFSNCSSLTNIIIPYSVMSIGEDAFSNCSSLTSITIPNSVTSIENDTFYNCSSLTSITIPNSVTSIGGSAFSNCSSLTSITIPDSVTSIECYAFYGCSSLTDINYQGTIAQWNDIYKDSQWDYNTGEYTIHCTDGDIEWTILAYKLNYNGDSYIVTGLRDSQISELIIPSTYNGKPVTGIGGSAFSNCSSLTSITIPNSVTSIESRAFAGCTGLASVTIGNGVDTIGDYVFENCISLTSISIPDSVTSIGSGAFTGCYSLIEVYNQSSLGIVAGSSDYGNVGLYAKNVYTQEGQSKLSTDENGYVIYTEGENKLLIKYTGGDDDLTLPNGINEIYRYAFFGSNVTSITIPSSVTSIGEAAISYCRNLTSITIPSSVTSIGDYALIVCQNLEIIVFQGTKEQWNTISKGRYWNEETGNYTIRCTDGDIAKE